MKLWLQMTPKWQVGGKKNQQSHSCSTLKEKHHEKRAKVIEFFLFCRSHKWWQLWVTKIYSNLCWICSRIYMLCWRAWGIGSDIICIKSLFRGQGTVSSRNNPIIIVHKLFSKSCFVSSCVEREELSFSMIKIGFVVLVMQQMGVEEAASKNKGHIWVGNWISYLLCRW